MEITLSPASAARIRDVLGEAVDLSPAAVPHVLARLAEDAPDVYSRVLDELSGSQITLDSERMLRQRHRRTAMRRLLFGWGEYDSDAGDRVLAKRRVAAVLPVGVAALMLAVAGLSALGGRPHRGVSPSAPARTLRPVPPRASLRGTLLDRAPHPRTVTRAAEPRQAGSAAPAFIPSPPPLPPLPSVPLPPFFRDRAPAAGPPPSPVVFSRASSGDDASAGRADTGLRSSVVYAREDAGVSAAPRNARMRAPGPSRRRGDRIAARLATGIIVTPGGPPLPVVVTGVTDGSTWLGHAVAGPGGRVEISLGLVSDGAPHPGPSAGGAAPVRGVALDRDRLAVGLPARIVVRRGAAAAAAMRAIVQAASDYLQALARAGQITVVDGASQLTIGDAGPGWTYAASRLAENLSPQGSGGVQTLELAAGTPCVILITEAP